MPDAPTKYCRHCLATKAMCHFPDTRQAICRDCANANRRTVYRLRRAHTPPADVICTICRRPDDRICLDHDHSTGAFRGWLCGNCNRGLGHFGDSLEMIERAAEYLKTHARGVDT